MTCSARYHGTATAYTKHRCRCDSARADKRLLDKLRKLGKAQPKLIDATGTRRRIEALMALGWPFLTIAAELGYAPSSVPWRLVTQSLVHINTAARVSALYERLSMTPGPNDRTRRAAARAGYVPPLAWDDDAIEDPAAKPSTRGLPPVLIDPVAVERALAGDPARPLNIRETREAVRRAVTDLVMPDAAIEDRLSISRRSVQRIRKELDLPSVWPASRRQLEEHPAWA